jgi:hypothetical protein
VFQGAQSGSIPFAFTLLDSLQDPATLTAEFSTNNGANFTTAKTAVSVTTGLLTADPGNSLAAFGHVFVWDSVGDLPAADGQAIKFRLLADDGLLDGDGAEQFVDLTLSNVVGGGDAALTVRTVNPAEGNANGGTKVTIVGTGFDPSNPSDLTVTFGSAAATEVAVVSETLLTATTPSGALGEQVDVAITSAAANETGTLPTGFSYLPEVTFNALQTVTPDEADRVVPINLVLRLGQGQSLATPLSVEVADAATGTATAGLDYQGFGTASTTFAIGATSGAVATVSVSVIQDLLTEGDEDVVLRLLGPSPGFALGPVTEHRVRITDDELAVVAFDPIDARAQITGTAALGYTVTGPDNKILTLEESPFDGSATTQVFGSTATVTPFPAFPDGAAPSAVYRLRANLPGDDKEDAQIAFADTFLLDLNENGADEVHGVAVFPDGSYAIGGFFVGATTFGGTNDPAPVTLPGTFGETGYVARFNADGTLRWVRPCNANQEFSDVTGLTATPDGGLFIVGQFDADETLTFAGLSVAGDGVTSDHVFVARLDADGNAVWLRRDGDGAGERSRFDAVAAHPDGGCVALGDFNGTMSFGAGDLTQIPLTSRGAADLVLARYAPDGSLVWARSAGGGLSDRSADVDLFADGSVVIGGSIEVNVRAGTNAVSFGFDKTGAEVVFPDADVGRDAFIARYDPAGRLCWARKGGTDNRDNGFGVSALRSGVAALAGSFAASTGSPGAIFGTITLGPGGGQDGFLVLYDPDGDELAGTRFGGTESDSIAKLSRLPDDSLVALASFRSAPTGIPVSFGDGELNETDIEGDPAGSDLALLRFLPELVTVGGESHPRPKLAYARHAASSVNRDLADALGVTPTGGAVFVAHSLDQVTAGRDEGGEILLDFPPFSDGNPIRELPFVARYEPVNYRITEVKPEGHGWTAFASGGNPVGIALSATADGGAHVVARFTRTTEIGFGGAGNGQTITLEGNRFLAR